MSLPRPASGPIFLAAAAFAAAVVLAQPAPEGLFPSDAARVQVCRDNLAPEALLPELAPACAEFLKDGGGRVLKALSRADAMAAGEFLSQTATLADLSAITTDETVSSHELRKSLRRLLQCDDFPLCALGLGPEPEKVHAWAARLARAGKLSPGRLESMERAVLLWEGLEAGFRERQSRAAWLKLDLGSRSDEYREWMREACGTGEWAEAGPEEAARMARVLEAELPEELLAQLKGCMNRLRETPAGGSGPAGGQAPAAHEAAAAPPASVSAPQARAVAAALGDPIFDELRDTIVGSRLLEFYERPPEIDGGNTLNKLSLAFQRFDDPKHMALWDGEAIHFSLGYLESWLSGRGMSPERLAADKGALAALARTLGPVFVHEATHQTQAAFFRRHGIPAAMATLEEEVGAAVSGALFVQEKLAKRGTPYQEELSGLDVRLHEAYLDGGVRGIRVDRRQVYLDAGFGSSFPQDRVAAKVFGNERMRKDYARVAGEPWNAVRNRSLANAMSRNLEKYGVLMEKYQKDEAWFDSLRKKLVPSKEAP